MPAQGSRRTLATLTLTVLGGCHLLGGYNRLSLRDNADLAWRLAATGEGDASVTAIGASANGNVVLGGTFSGDLELGTTTLSTSAEASAFVAVIAPDGSVSRAVALESSGRVQPLAAVGTRLGGIFAEELRTGTRVLAKATGSEALFLLDVDESSEAFVSARSFGGAGFSSPKGQLALAQDGSGNTLIAGSYAGALTFDGCPPYPTKNQANLFLAKLDPAGNCVWSLRNDDDAPQGIGSVAADPLNDFVLVGGEFVGKLTFGDRPVLQSSGGVDLFLARLDGKGAAQWSRSIGNGLTQGGARVAAAPGGFSALVGFFEGEIDLGAAPLMATRGHDIVVANFRPNGQLDWQKQLSVDRAPCVPTACAFDDLQAAFDPEGNLVVAGPFEDSIDIEGVTLTTGADRAAYFLVKFDRSGNLLWSGHFGDDSDTCALRGHCELALAIDPQSDIFLGGSFANRLEFSAMLHGNAEAGNGPLFSNESRDGFLAKFRR